MHDEEVGEEDERGKLRKASLGILWTRRPLTGEQLLQLAVLEDAIGVFLKGSGKTPKGRAEFWEADWYVKTDRRYDYVFSFPSTCFSLGLNPEAVRECLIAAAAKSQPARARRVRTRPNVRQTIRLRPKKRHGEHGRQKT